jgi:hypothetical protein
MENYQVRVQCRCQDGIKHHYLERIIYLPFIPYDGLWIYQLLLKNRKSKLDGVTWVPYPNSDMLRYGYFVCQIVGGTDMSEVHELYSDWKKAERFEALV